MNESVAIRAMQPADVDGADCVLRAAFQRETSFAAHLRLTMQLEPGGIWLAERSGRILGTVGAVTYGPLAYIGLMAVDPTEQSQGLGRRLMNYLLTWLGERRCTTVLLDATDAGARLYATMGFVDDHTAYVYERAVFDEPPTPACAATISAANVEDLDAIAVFDAPIFGANRHKLFAQLWPEHRPNCLVARDRAGKLRGYLLVRDNQLGPWAAADASIADALLRQALDGIFDKPPYALVPRSNSACAELLTKFGFVERRRLRHMRRGGSYPPGIPRQLFAQASFAHG